MFVFRYFLIALTIICIAFFIIFSSAKSKELDQKLFRAIKILSILTLAMLPIIIYLYKDNIWLGINKDNQLLHNPLLQQIRSNVKHINTLKISNYAFKNFSAAQLESALLTNTHIHKIDITLIEKNNAQALGKILANIATIKTIKITNTDYLGIIEFLKIPNHHIHTIILNNNYLSNDYQVDQVIQELQKFTNLKFLDLSSNKIADAKIDLQDILKQNKVTDLILKSNYLSTLFIESLANSLKQNTSLTKLDLTDNNLNTESCALLFKTLANNTNLKTIHFGNICNTPNIN
jgi:hypothetical protein